MVAELISRGVVSLLVQALKLLEFSNWNIGNCPKCHCPMRPMDNIVAVQRQVAPGNWRRIGWPCKDIDDMLATSVNKCCHRSVCQVVEPAADQRKPLGSEIL